MLFFGCSVVFAAIHRLTQHSSKGVVVGAQLAALVVIVTALVLFVRSRERRDD